MTILTDQTDTTPDFDPAGIICRDECEHWECLHLLASLWADAVQPLTPPF